MLYKNFRRKYQDEHLQLNQKSWTEQRFCYYHFYLNISRTFLLLFTIYNSIFQLRVIAYDSVYPNNKATSTVTIAVQRNLFAPQFNNQPYATTVDEIIPLGTSIITINATDPEGVGLFHLFNNS